MSNRALYLKPGDVLYVLYKGKARAHTHETVNTLVLVEGHLQGKRRRLSAREIRELETLGSGSLLNGFAAKRRALAV